MASKRAIKAIDWSAIAARISEADLPIFAAFKSKSDGFLRRMEEYPESTPSIDWAYYKKNIAGSLVDQFQKEYEKLNVPYPVDKYTSTVEEQAEECTQAVQSFITQSNERIKEYESKIIHINGLLPFDQMTMEDFTEAYPDIAWNPEKPTIWPHIPEFQPGDEPEPIPPAEH